MQNEIILIRHFCNFPLPCKPTKKLIKQWLPEIHDFNRDCNLSHVRLLMKLSDIKKRKFIALPKTKNVCAGQIYLLADGFFKTLLAVIDVDEDKRVVRTCLCFYQEFDCCFKVSTNIGKLSVMLSADIYFAPSQFEQMTLVGNIEANSIQELRVNLFLNNTNFHPLLWTGYDYVSKVHGASIAYCCGEADEFR